jgi:hypothetical protein
MFHSLCVSEYDVSVEGKAEGMSDSAYYIMNYSYVIDVIVYSHFHPISPLIQTQIKH